MAGFTIEGELESLTPRQIEFVGEVLRKRGLNNPKVRIETLGKAGDNYAANVKMITTELDNGETFKMVTKIAPNNELLREKMGTALLFTNEGFMYNEILPKFVGLQQAAGLSKEELFRYPECYGTLMEPLHEIILLEDLKELNFQMLDRFTPLTNESVRQILKNFAILHSLSFVLKRREPDVFDSYGGKLKDMFSLGVTEEFLYFLNTIETDTIAVLDSEKYKKAVRGSISQLYEQTLKIFKYENNSTYSVVNHGDGWTNNVMFRLEENVPFDSVLIDYQASKVGNPVCDLQYLIFSCTDYSTRHQHYLDWIDFYHSELDKSLANFGLKASYVYPRDRLDADLRRYAKVYFSTAIMLYAVLIRKSEDASKMKELMEKDMDLKLMAETMQPSGLDPESVHTFKTKIENLVDSYREFGYLDLSN